MKRAVAHQADWYHGQVAENYELSRKREKKWQVEQSLIQGALASLPPTRILDVPVGTGRFFELYRQQSVEVVGVDRSADMALVAQEKIRRCGVNGYVKQGSIWELPFSHDSFRVAICMRLLNWFDIEEVTRALKELARVTERTVIVGLRHRVPLRECRRSMLQGIAWQLQVRSKGWVTRATGGKMTYLHSKKALFEAFAKAGLRPERRSLVERDEGRSEYNVWELTSR